MESESLRDYVGVDICKEHLDVCWPGGRSSRLNNDKAGVGRLLREAKKIGRQVFVVCEATGGYERLLQREARETEVAICVVNPARVRHFTKAKGVLAKNDQIDAAQLQDFGQHHHPRPARELSKDQEQMQVLVMRRSQLVDELAREKTRLTNPTFDLINASLNRMIRFLEKEIARIEEQIRQLEKSDANLSAKSQILQQTTGVGEVTAWALLAYLPELGEVNRRRVASLVGVAPWARDTGTTEGRRFIFGGRAKVRKALYMAALSARAHNPILKAYSQRLAEKNKPEKVILVAVMRKLLIHLNSQLQNQKILVA